jgi:hypothetical protein
MMPTIDADDAWWPPTLPLGFSAVIGADKARINRISIAARGKFQGMI